MGSGAEEGAEGNAHRRFSCCPAAPLTNMPRRALTCCTDGLTTRFDGKRPDHRSWQPRQQGKREGLSGPILPPLYLHTSVSVLSDLAKDCLEGLLVAFALFFCIGARMSWHIQVPLSSMISSPISRALSGHPSFPHNQVLICKLSFITQTLLYAISPDLAYLLVRGVPRF